MKRLLRFIFALFKSTLLLILFVSALVAGMGFGGFYMLDYIIKGEEMEMPRLYRKSKSEAIEILTQHGLSLHLPVEEQQSDDVPPGIVIEQRPYPGKIVKKGRGRKVYLTISAGLKKLVVPDLVGKQENEVITLLSTKGLEMGTRATVYHAKAQHGEIIAQDPPSGPREIHSKKVDVLVSLGPELPAYVMPDLTGMDVQIAKNRIQKEPFTLTDDDITIQQTDLLSEWNTVLSQRPQPGAKVITDENIKLTIGGNGSNFASLRIVKTDLPIPDGVDKKNLAIFVWDDCSKMYANLQSLANFPETASNYLLLFDLKGPRRIPLELSIEQTSIETEIAIFGNALIMLCLDKEFPLPVSPFYSTQYFPMTD